MRRISLMMLLSVSPLAAQVWQVDSASVHSALTESRRSFNWSVFSFTSSEIGHFPFRGLDSYLQLIPGVSFVNNEIHIRGSRSYEGGYLLDNFNVTNPFLGSSGVRLIPEAIDQIDVHTGAYGAALGSANGGIIATRMRTGGEKLEYSVDMRTDDIARPGNRILNTTPLGYKNFVGTIGGPLPAPDEVKIRFFAAGEYTSYRNRQAMFLEPFRYDSLKDDGYYRAGNLGKPLPGSVTFRENWLPNNWLKRTTLQGNASIDYGGLRLKVLGSYDEQENLEGTEWPYALTNYFNQERAMLTRATTKFGAGAISYDFSPQVSARLGVYFYDRFGRTFDRKLKHNWFSYADSDANARFYDTSQWLDRYTGPDIYSTIYAFHFNAPGSPNNSYSKNRQSSLGTSFDLHANVSPQFRFDVGAKFDSWTMRSFSVSYISGLRKFLDQNRDGIEDAAFASEYERRVRWLDRGIVHTYGYTFLGAETDGYTMAGSAPGAILDKPYKPFFGSMYVTCQMNSSDLILEAGLRYEYFQPNFKRIEPTLNPAASGSWDDYSNIPYNVGLGIIDESRIRDTEPMQLFLPRLNAQFILNEQTTLFASYGRYAQMPRLDFLYMSSYEFSRAVAPEDRTPYGGNLSFEVRPEMSSHFEIGGTHHLNPGLVVSGSVYSKSLIGQVQIDQQVNAAGSPIFTLYRNNGEGRSKGLELGIALARNHGFAVTAHYVYSASEGFTSNPRSNARQVSDTPLPVNPKSMFPYDYDQAHRATALMSFRVDDQTDPFAGLDFVAVLTFNSGHRFTKEQEVQNLGPYDAWSVGVNSLRDVRFVAPVEPFNSSKTPSCLNIDLRISKKFTMEPVSLTIFLNVLNVFNTKNVINVYPTTGTPNDDSWFSNPIENTNFSGIPNYESFYRDINLKNRWAYSTYSGNDVYGSPRQFQLGVTVEM